MKLKREEIARIAGLILKNLREHHLFTPKAGDDKILSEIEAIIARNMDDELKIEDEVKKIMEQYKTQIASGAVDPQKIYTMIKKQVAKERKFVL